MSKPSEHEDEQYRLKGACPRCGTVITLGTDNLRLMMFLCEGCGSGIAYHEGRILAVRAKFLEALNIAFKTRYCGTVEEYDMKNRYKSAPGVPPPDSFREALGVEEDCLATLERLNGLLDEQ